jgi:cytochrome c oxidase assembly protein subunit 15
MLHYYSRLVAASTLLLIVAGAMVTSTESGLSVPDWPTSYGYNMFAFPLSSMVGGILYEHGHRLVASTVGFLTIILAGWLWWSEDRPWLRGLGFAALGAVILQGVLGGLTVLFLLPAPISIGHAGLAQIFFCLTTSIALFTSRGWKEGYVGSGLSRTPQDRSRTSQDRSRTPQDRSRTPQDRSRRSPDGRSGADAPTLRRLTIATTAVIYLQILLGAAMRHTGAGLAIPDFPLAFGRLIPPRWDTAIAVHFAHRVGAIVVACLILATASYLWRRHRDRRELVRPAALLVALVAIQVSLGASVVLTGKAVWVNSAHVAVGAVVLVTSLVLALRAHRGKVGHMPVGTGLKARATVAHGVAPGLQTGGAST